MNCRPLTPVVRSASAPAIDVRSFSSPLRKYTRGQLNLRSGPGTSYERVGAVGAGTALQVLGQSGDWYLINHYGRDAFVAGWLTFDSPLTQSSGGQTSSGSAGFSCSPRKTCSQMVSCAEAQHHLTVCGNRQLDGNSNGVPCEDICAGQQPAQQQPAQQQPVQQQPVQQQPVQQQSFTCDCKKTCPNMTCAEAQFQLNRCNCTARDRNRDGLACDSQCR